MVGSYYCRECGCLTDTLIVQLWDVRPTHTWYHCDTCAASFALRHPDVRTIGMIDEQGVFHENTAGTDARLPRDPATAA